MKHNVIITCAVSPEPVTAHKHPDLPKTPTQARESLGLCVPENRKVGLAK